MHNDISEQNARFREVGDSTPVLMWTTDASGICDWFNKPWLEFTGLELSTAVANGRFGSVPAEDREPAQAAFELASAQRDSIELEYRLQSRLGTYRWMLDRSVPRFAVNGDYVGYVGVCVDITYQYEYRQRLADREAVLKQLHSINEQERSFLSCAIHDGLLQDVIGGEMLVQGMADLDSDALEKRVAQVRETLRSAIAHGRRLIGELRPMILDEQGLVSAVEFYAAELENRGEIKINVQSDVQIDVSLTFWEGNVFRIIQEALNNVEAHSQSANAEVRMSTNDGRMRVIVRDFGVGFDVEAAADSFGLRCMFERAEIYGGSLSIDSSPTGTMVALDVPVPPLSDVARRNGAQI